MPYQTIDPINEWRLDKSYEAAAEQDILVTNTGTEPLRWLITTNTTAPTVSVDRGHIVPAMTGWPMKLKAGERIWFAGNTKCTLEHS